MRKSIESYLNDPRIVDDPEMAAAPNAIKEIHAIRLRIQDEHDVLSSEYIEHCHNATIALFARYGLTPHYADF
ncbi:hypothetical protein ACYULU_06555 [Breznakiellaceae bacterium SP9]